MKKMIKIAFVAAFAAIAGYGVYANQKSEVLSDLTLANVEALAGSGETTIECCLALWGTCKCTGCPSSSRLTLNVKK